MKCLLSQSMMTLKIREMLKCGCNCTTQSQEEILQFSSPFDPFGLPTSDLENLF